MAEDFRFGMDAKVYYGTAGSTANTALNNVQEVSPAFTKEEFDATTRDSGWKNTRSTLKDFALEITLLVEPADAGFKALVASAVNRTAMSLAVLDKASGEGIDADWEVMSFRRAEPINGMLTQAFTCRIRTELRNPDWTGEST